MSSEAVVSYVSLSLNAVSIICSCAIEYKLLFSWRIIPKREWMIIFHLFNVFSQALAIVCTLFVLQYPSISQWIWEFNILAFLNGFNLFAITMLNISILETFSVLLEYINEFKINLWRYLNVLLFCFLLWPPIVDLFISNDPVLNQLLNDFLQVYSVFVVIYDNSQAFFLAFVVFRWSGEKARGHEKALIHEFSKTVSTILLLVLLDWIAIASLAIGFATTSNPINQALAGIATAIGGLHLSGMAFIFLNLKGMVNSVRRRPAEVVQPKNVDESRNATMKRVVGSKAEDSPENPPQGGITSLA